MKFIFPKNFVKIIYSTSVHDFSRTSVAHSHIREERTKYNDAKNVSWVSRLLISGKILYDLAKYVKKKKDIPTETVSSKINHYGYHTIFLSVYNAANASIYVHVLYASN